MMPDRLAMDVRLIAAFLAILTLSAMVSHAQNPLDAIQKAGKADRHLVELQGIDSSAATGIATMNQDMTWHFFALPNYGFKSSELAASRQGNFTGIPKSVTDWMNMTVPITPSVVAY